MISYFNTFKISLMCFFRVMNFMYHYLVLIMCSEVGVHRGTREFSSVCILGSQISKEAKRWSWHSWYQLYIRIIIIRFDIAQNMVFIEGKTAEEESKTYSHNTHGPSEAIWPVKLSNHTRWRRNIFCHQYWIDDKAHEWEHRWKQDGKLSK